MTPQPVQFGTPRPTARVWAAPAAYVAFVIVYSVLTGRLFSHPFGLVGPLLMAGFVLWMALDQDRAARVGPDGVVFRQGRKETPCPLADITDITVTDQKYALGSATLVTFHKGRFDDFTIRVGRRSRSGPGREALEQKVRDAQEVLRLAPTSGASTSSTPAQP